MGNGIEIWGIPEVQEKFKVESPEQVIDYLGMMGDAVDNIPGLPGVGDKTAKKFIKAYGSMEGLLGNTSDLKGKLKEKIEAKLILQVHDELILDTPEGEIDAVVNLITDSMMGAAKLDVPLEVDIGIGDNWDQAH